MKGKYYDNDDDDDNDNDYYYVTFLLSYSLVLYCSGVFFYFTS